MPKQQPKKLTETQITELAIKHANGTSKSALAKEYGISRNTVNVYLAEQSDVEQEFINIKRESVTQWLKDNTGRIQGLLDLCVELLPKKLKEASARDVVGAYKILSETSINNVESKQQGDDGDALDRLCKEIREASQKEQDDA